MTYRYQLDADGNEVTTDIALEIGKGDNDVSQGAQINAAQKYNGRIQFGQDGADQAAFEAAELKIQALAIDLDRLQSSTAAGIPMNKQQVTGLYGGLSDTVMAWVKSGGNENDQQMVDLRARIEEISRAGVSNR